MSEQTSYKQRVLKLYLGLLFDETPSRLLKSVFSNCVPEVPDLDK